MKPATQVEQRARNLILFALLRMTDHRANDYFLWDYLRVMGAEGSPAWVREQIDALMLAGLVDTKLVDPRGFFGGKSDTDELLIVATLTEAGCRQAARLT